MKVAAKHRSKRDVITISDDESPAEKIAKRGEGGKDTVTMLPVPSPSPPLLPSAPSAEVAEVQQKVVDLQQQLEKKEKMFRKACRAAREAELRAERAEGLLDSKRGIVESVQNDDKMKKENDELKKKLANVSGQLKASKAETESIVQKANELSQLGRTFKEELQKTTWKEEESNKKILEMKAKEEVTEKKIVELEQQILALNEESKQLRALNMNRIVATNQNFTLNEDLKLERAKGEGMVKKISELEQQILALKEESKLMRDVNANRLELERQNLSLRAELKRMRVNEERRKEEINNPADQDSNDRHKEEMKVMRGKRDDAVKTINELKKKNRKLKELLEKQGKGDSKIDVAENSLELQTQNRALQEELKAVNGKVEAVNKISLALSRENFALKTGGPAKNDCWMGLMMARPLPPLPPPPLPPIPSSPSLSPPPPPPF